MATELIINSSLPETRISLMEDGEIQDLLIERASGKGIVGNIYKGKVTRVLPGMQAAFVDIGMEKAAFLYVDDVYVHSEIWEEEEGETRESGVDEEISAAGGTRAEAAPATESGPVSEGANELTAHEASSTRVSASEESGTVEATPSSESPEASYESEAASHLDSQEDLMDEEDSDEDEDQEEDDDHGPVEMGPGPEDGGDEENRGNREHQPPETIAPPADRGSDAETGNPSGAGGEGVQASGPRSDRPEGRPEGGGHRRRHRRGRRGGRSRRRDRGEGEGQRNQGKSQQVAPVSANYPENFRDQMSDEGNVDSDRATMNQQGLDAQGAPRSASDRPENNATQGRRNEGRDGDEQGSRRNEFKSQRPRDRRIRPRSSLRPARAQVNIQDLLKEGQEVLVQVAKDPIATKGARLTCHISLPGRHLVCMPTIDHVGVSRRIERDDERRRLREYVENNRPRNLGFIVRTASGKQQSEKRIRQDIEYLTNLWNEIREKAASVTAPALVYEDLNSVLRAIRDWVTEDIDKIIVDSRYHYNEIQRFVSHFMPSLKQKVELYHGDIPIFDAYNISTELSRALERKVWLKSGGYIVIDQAEALVAIDVNTGRYVGKKNLEDTILKTNLEAVQEIAYQLRLRNCGGIIILDLIDMEKEENRLRVYRALEEALKRDRARPTILKISELGLVEMTRKRTRDTIIRTLCESCTNCEGKGFIKSKQTVAYEVLREIEREGIDRDISKILVQAHQDVIDILAIDERETLDQLERRYRKQIYLQAVGDFHAEQFEVVGDKRERSDRSRDLEKLQDRDGEKRGRHRHRDRDRGRDRDRDHQSQSRRTESSNRPAAEGTGLPEPRPAGEPAMAQANPTSSAEPTSDTPTGTNPARDADGFYDEEDRLAFLRAQAAQDAALARLRSTEHVGRPANSGAERKSGEVGRGGGGGGGGRGRRGKRGGKFRRGDRDRGPRHQNQRDPSASGRNAGSHSDAPSDSSNQGPNGDNGGGDHSQPPV